jgi:hypothetical protein
MPDFGSFLDRVNSQLDRAWTEAFSHEALSITIVICLTLLLALLIIRGFALKAFQVTDVREIDIKQNQTHVHIKVGPSAEVERAALTSQAYLEYLKFRESRPLPPPNLYNGYDSLELPPPPIYTLEPRRGRNARRRNSA